jgi:hypothetical protein
MSENASTSAPTTSAAAPAPSAPAANSAPSGTAAPGGASPAPLASAAASTPANAAPQPWRSKVKVNGKEIDVSDKEIPAWFREAVGEEEAISTYRLRAAAQTSMKTAAEMRKESERILSSVKTPEQMMDALVRLYDGDRSKIDAAVEGFYTRLAKEQAMSPEQREAKRLREENARLKAEQEARTKAEAEQRRETMRVKAREQFQREFPPALEAVGLAAKTKDGKPSRALKLLAQHAMEAVNAGEAMDVARLAKDVATELREEWEALHGSLSEEQLLGLIGEERMAKVRAKDVERLRASQQATVPAVTSGVPQRAADGKFASREAAAKPASMREWFEKRRG